MPPLQQTAHIMTLDYVCAKHIIIQLNFHIKMALGACLIHLICPKLEVLLFVFTWARRLHNYAKEKGLMDN